MNARPPTMATWLRLDPVFKPLRGNPTFERLIASAPASK
jgi:hypothetical protein